MSLRIVHLNLDTLISAMERRPETKARARAWEWLATVERVTFCGPAILAPSATWSSTLYAATPDRCNCKARSYCWHQEAAAIIADAIAEDAAIDAAAERDAQVLPFDLADDLATFAPVERPQRKAKAYADIMECFA